MEACCNEIYVLASNRTLWRVEIRPPITQLDGGQIEEKACNLIVTADIRNAYKKI